LHQEATLTSSAKDSDITSTTPPEPSDSAVLSEVKGHNGMEETERTFSHDAGDHVPSVSGASGFTLADAGFTGIPAKLPGLCGIFIFLRTYLHGANTCTSLRENDNVIGFIPLFYLCVLIDRS
jgi:hypothetical protein